MNELLTIENREQAKKQQIIDLVLTNREEFRTKATKAYRDYIPKERYLLNSLEIDNITSYNVLAAWDTELRPLANALRNKRSDSIFRNLLAKHLVLNENEIQNKVNQIIEERESEALDNLIINIYPVKKGEKDQYIKQRKQIKKILLRPESEIEQLKDHQINYMIFKDIAMQNNITVVDAYAPLSTRIIKTIRARKERKNASVSKNKRLQYIEKRLVELSNMNDGLLGDILDKKLDLIIILSLRNQYEKHINELPKEEAKNAIKRLAIFDKETQKFRDDCAKKLIINSDHAGLESARTMTKNLDTLLLRIFDLTTIQKNQLLIYSKEHRELTQELVALSASN